MFNNKLTMFKNSIIGALYCFVEVHRLSNLSLSSFFVLPMWWDVICKDQKPEFLGYSFVYHV